MTKDWNFSMVNDVVCSEKWYRRGMKRFETGTRNSGLTTQPIQIFWDARLFKGLGFALNIQPFL
jgi:hypothetical protein